MLKHLCDNFSLNSIEKDFIVTIQDCFKDLSLHVKLEIKCIHNIYVIYNIYIIYMPYITYIMCIAWYADM